MKQAKHKSGKNSGRIVKENRAVQTLINRKQPSKTTSHNYLYSREQKLIVRPTCEFNADRVTLEGQSIKNRNRIRARDLSYTASFNDPECMQQYRQGLHKKRSCQHFSETLASSYRQAAHNQHSHSIIPPILYPRRNLSKKSAKVMTPVKGRKTKKSLMSTRKDSRGIQSQLTHHKNQVHSSKMLKSVRDFSLLTNSHRSIDRINSNAKIHTNHKEQHPYQKPTLMSMYLRTNQLLKAYSGKYKNLLKINERLNQELTLLRIQNETKPTSDAKF